MKELVREVKMTMSAQQQLMVMLLKPWKFLFNNEKRRRGKIGRVLVQQSCLQQDQQGVVKKAV
jgi:hypothetical protein